MKCWTKVLCVSALIWLSCCCGPSTKTATPPSLSLLISLDCPRISVSGLPSPRIPAGRADFVKNKTRGGSKSVLNGASNGQQSGFCNFPSGVSVSGRNFLVLLSQLLPLRLLLMPGVPSRIPPKQPTLFWQRGRNKRIYELQMQLLQV